MLEVTFFSSMKNHFFFKTKLKTQIQTIAFPFQWQQNEKAYLELGLKEHFQLNHQFYLLN